MSSIFIKVEKNGEVIEVHPDVLAEHLQLGWKVLEEQPVEEKQDAADKPFEKKAKK